VTLPQLDDAAIRSDLRFQDWYAARGDLRERSPIVFVQPPSATQEAVLTTPSETFASCGFQEIIGGVSLGNRGARTGGYSPRVDLDPGLNRSGLVTSATDPATGALRIETRAIDDAGQVADSVARTLSQPSDGRAMVLVAGSPRRVASFGGLKVSRAQTATREFTLQLEADRGQVAQRADFQGVEVGELVTRKVDVLTTTVQWRSGPLDRLRSALQSIQARWTSRRGADPPEPTDGVLYAYEEGSGRRMYRIGDGWFEITDQLSPPGEELVLQGGGPAPPETGGPAFFQARRVPPPNPPGDSFTVQPGPPARIEVGVLRRDAPTVRVETADGRTATAFQVGDSLSASPVDPVLGLSGTVEGAALMRDWPVVQNAMRSAARDLHGRSFAVLMDGDGVAFAFADHVVIAGAGHPWYERVLRAIDPASPERLPEFGIENGQAIHFDSTPLPPLGSGRRGSMRDALDEAKASDATYYFDRSLLPFEGGVVLWDNLPRDRGVIVSEVPEAAPSGRTSPADVRVSQGREWVRFSAFGGAGGGPGGGGGAVGSPIQPGPAFFVSLDCEDPEAAYAKECES
jgi:hypothetical protein